VTIDKARAWLLQFGVLAWVTDVETVARVERRRKWTIEEKAALLAEVEAEGGKVQLVARRHRVSESLLYNWRSAWKAAASAAIGSSGAVAFVPLGVLDEADGEAPQRYRHRNRRDRPSGAKAERGRSRSPCRTAPASASIPS
jgi:transposase-like protein